MDNKIKLAFLIAVTGTITLYILGKVLHGLIGTPWELISCSIGAFVSTYLVAMYNFKSNFISSLAIVFITFIFISIGHAGEQVFSRHVSVDFEPLVLFFWATVMTSWWLVPLVGYTLKFFKRKLNY